jgi:mRNA-degrading endonuclease toxin of MazEF toxin-antitoxin module
VAVTDQVRAVSKERLVSRIGTLAEGELLALEDGLREVMNLG